MCAIGRAAMCHFGTLRRLCTGLAERGLQSAAAPKEQTGQRKKESQWEFESCCGLKSALRAKHVAACVGWALFAPIYGGGMQVGGVGAYQDDELAGLPIVAAGGAVRRRAVRKREPVLRNSTAEGGQAPRTPYASRGSFEGGSCPVLRYSHCRSARTGGAGLTIPAAPVTLSPHLEHEILFFFGRSSGWFPGNCTGGPGRAASPFTGS